MTSFMQHAYKEYTVNIFTGSVRGDFRMSERRNEEIKSLLAAKNNFGTTFSE